MPCRRALALMLLVLCGGCAVQPDRPAAWTRHPDRYPWTVMGNVTPDAHWIANALYDDVFQIDLERCPFRLATCRRENVASETDTNLIVENVACRAVAEEEESCRFDLVEEVPGRGRARSRCTARFEVVGGAHDPHRWGVQVRDGDYQDHRLRCRPSPWRPAAPRRNRNPA